jgi:glycosyltransferase involved in cell wall biosynthesis
MMKFTRPLFKRLTGRGLGSRDPLSVGVLVDIVRSPSAGGHVKCWERLAEAARGEPVDLTVYFLGRRRVTVSLSPNVRIIDLKPWMNTRWFSFLRQNVDHTDLAPLSPRLLWLLREHQVIHTTGAHFALARTGLLFARATGRPLVNSIHTDIAGYARVYTRQVLGRIFGGRVAGLLRDRWRIQDRLGDWMLRKLHRHLVRCKWVLASRWSDVGRDPDGIPAERFSVLRRGIDKEHFHPSHRNRPQLEKRFGIGRDRVVLLFVGRVDPSKNVLTLARTVRHLLDRRLPIHLLVAGEGSQSDEIQRKLGDRVTLAGRLSYQELGWVYASADLFVFPSELEIAPNVVQEAKASGLPVVVSTKGGSPDLIRRPGRDGLVIDGRSPERWADAVEALVLDPERRAVMGELARRHVEMERPSWREVLREDLLPVWQRVAAERRKA